MQTDNNLTTLSEEEFLFDTPKSYFDIIDDFVVGQEDLKKTLSLCCFRHNILKDKKQYFPNHMLIAGPSGTGKTFSISTLLKNIDLPYSIFDSSTVTMTGYVGNSFDNSISLLYHSSGNDIEKTETGVVVFDEIDKLFSSFKEDITRSGAQNELLRLLEGNTIQIHNNINEDPIFINTSRMLFIFLGSFNKFKDVLYNEYVGMYKQKSEKKEKISPLDFPDKLLKCGLNPELVGRISYFSQTFSLEKREIKNAIITKKNSIISSYKDFFSSFSLNLKLEESFIDYILDTIDLEKFGMRKVFHLFNNYLFEIMYKVNELKYNNSEKDIYISYNKKDGVHYIIK